MTEKAPVEKNSDYIIDIKGMGYEGEGVGKINDFTIFVPGAIKGEKVKVKIVKLTKSFAFGKLIDIIEPSLERREPVCGIYNKCGGCQLQHLSYEGQLEFKKMRVKDCLTRIGKQLVKEGNDADSPGIVLHDTIGMEDPYRYRNKVQLPVGTENSDVKIGFYAERSHTIIDMESCHIQDEIADKVVKLTKEWILKNNIPTYDENKHAGLIRHVMVRRAFKTGEVMVVLVTNGKEIPAVDNFIETMKSNIINLKSIIQNVNTKRTNVILDNQCVTLWGKDAITDYIGKFRFNISPLSFFQVNPTQTEVLYEKALEFAGLTGEEIVFDAYCGTGTISLFLSQKASMVYGVEVVSQAIENAVKNASDNGIRNVEFITGECEKVIPELINNGVKASVVVVDPPRKGCESSLLKAIVDMSPEKIVYVSCDPGTLARDLLILDELGYKTLEVQPVDMFPQTAHVETVTLIERK